MGLQVGPANEVARDVVDLAEPQADGRVDALHPLGLNAFVRGPRGIELVAARTLSMERQWRQLSVRRLVFDAEDRPIQWLHGLYRPDRYEYEMKLARVGDIDARVWVSSELSAQFH